MAASPTQIHSSEIKSRLLLRGYWKYPRHACRRQSLLADRHQNLFVDISTSTWAIDSIPHPDSTQQSDLLIALKDIPAASRGSQKRRRREQMWPEVLEENSAEISSCEVSHLWCFNLRPHCDSPLEVERPCLMGGPVVMTESMWGRVLLTQHWSWLRGRVDVSLPASSSPPARHWVSSCWLAVRHAHTRDFSTQIDERVQTRDRRTRLHTHTQMPLSGGSGPRPSAETEGST